MSTQQRDFGWMALCQKPRNEDLSTIAICEELRHVARIQYLNSGLSIEKLAERLGIAKSTLSELLSGAGRKNMNPKLYRPFCWATGSRGIYQWLRLDEEGLTGKAARIAYLERQLEKERAA